MLSDPADVWDHLREDTTFKTYSDERLALLFLENCDHFPVHMLIKVFDVLLDPRFKLEEITFKSFWDIFRCISDDRRQDALANETARVVPPESRVYSVPPLAVSLVVDGMVEDRPQLGVLAEEKDWKDAYKLNTADFHAMSLVHPTWTPIARSALQRRVVVPHYQVDSFLLSPLCGPWVTEMVVYWTIDNGLEGATESDVDFFQALLERTPQLKSLAFVSSLTWPSYEWETNYAPPFRVCECLDIISDLVPSIESLWLRHFCADSRVVTIEANPDSRYYSDESHGGLESRSIHLSDSLGGCKETDILIFKLPGMHSLKFLSMHSWKTLTQDDMKRAPSLETVEIRSHDTVATYRSRAQGEEVRLFALSYNSFTLSQFRESELSSLESLEMRDYWHLGLSQDSRFLQKCDSLVNLELSTTDFDAPPIGSLPSSLKYLKINLCWFLPDDIQEFCYTIRSLPNLRSIILSFRKERYDEDEDECFDEETLRSILEPPLRPVTELCKARGIELVMESEISRVTLAYPA